MKFAVDREGTGLLTRSGEDQFEDIETVHFEPNLSVAITDEVLGKRSAVTSVNTNLDEVANARRMLAGKINVDEPRIDQIYHLASPATPVHYRRWPIRRTQSTRL